MNEKDEGRGNVRLQGNLRVVDRRPGFYAAIEGCETTFDLEFTVEEWVGGDAVDGAFKGLVAHVKYLAARKSIETLNQRLATDVSSLEVVPKMRKALAEARKALDEAQSLIDSVEDAEGARRSEAVASSGEYVYP